MADETIDIPKPDITDPTQGSQTVPMWAKESTLKDMLDVIKNLTGATAKMKKAFETVAEETAKGNTQEGKNLEAIADAIDDIKDDDSGTKIFGANTKTISIWQTALKVGAGAMTIFGSTVIAVGYALKGLGNDLRDVRGGTSLDLVGAGGLGDAALFRTGIQTLGYSADEVSSRLEDSSSVIAAVGRSSFWSMTREIQNITGAGANFGQTLLQIGDALDDDLKLRQSIGILSMIDGNKQAKRSADLYAHQLKATALLGKSINDIASAADDVLTTEASINMLIQSMGLEEGNIFTTAFREMAGDMAARGMKQGANNAIQYAMLEQVAFNRDTGAGGDLFQALTQLDMYSTAGGSLVEQIVDINAAKNRGDMESAQTMMLAFSKNFEASAKSLTTGDDGSMRAMIAVLEQFGDLGHQITLSLGQFRQVRKYESVNFTALAKSSAALDNAVQKFRSGIAGPMTSILAAFGTPLAGIMEAFTEGEITLDGIIKTQKEYDKLTDEEKKRVEGGSIFWTFNIALGNILEALKDFFAITKEGGLGIKSFSQLIRDKINPIIKGFSDRVVKWIDSWTAKSVEDTIDNILWWFGAIGTAAEKVAYGLGYMASLLVGTTTNDKGEEVFSMKWTLVKALAFAFGFSLVKNAIAGAFSWAFAGMGAMIGGIASKIPGLRALTGMGKTAATTGAGFGAGATGMLAFGAAAAGVGIALFGITEAMELFQTMDWPTFGKSLLMMVIPIGLFAGALALLVIPLAGVAVEMGVIGLALAGLGAAAAGIGKGFELIMGAFDPNTEHEIAMQDATTENINKLAGMDKAGLDSTAAGISAIAASMVEFGDATNDRWLSGPDLDDQEKQLSIFEKFAQLDGVGLMAFTDSLTALIESINELNAIETSEIVASANAVRQLHNSTQIGIMNAVATRILGTAIPQVSTSSALTAHTQIPSPVSHNDLKNNQDAQLDLLRENNRLLTAGNKTSANILEQTG